MVQAQGGDAPHEDARATTPFCCMVSCSPPLPPSTDAQVDCEGCEHEVMGEIEEAAASGAVTRVTGECHALRGLAPAKAARCLKVLRGLECKHGISPYLTCNRPPRGTPAAALGGRVPSRLPPRGAVPWPALARLGHEWQNGTSHHQKLSFKLG